MNLKCTKCDWSGQPNLSMSGDHIKATCGECKRYIKFISYKILDADDLVNLKKWQEDQVESACDYPHDDKDLMIDEIEINNFNYCPGCGVKL